jgi:hypothetical protein
VIPRLVRNVCLSTWLVYVLTIIHHVYGAIAFDTPWRHHAAFLGLGGIAATLLFMWGAARWRTPVLRQVAAVLLLALTLVLAVGLIGLFERGYNHAVKLLLFFGGAAPDTMHRLFPPPTYEMPSDVFFEVTGVLQFLAALVAARAGLALWRSRQESALLQRSQRARWRYLKLSFSKASELVRDRARIPRC